MNNTNCTSRNTTDEVKERRGEVLVMLRELLAERRDDDVIELVAKLVAHNKQLQKQLADMITRRRKGEGVSSAQLKLFLDELATEGNESLDEANNKLTKSAGLEEESKKDPKVCNPPRQPRHRRPAPPELRRVDNPISVPDGQRPCPTCGAGRVCIGHDVTEVIELIPAEVIVRVDRREKLACKACEGELVRAPRGDKVIEGGKFGTNLVAKLLVDKYRDGLPLNRQKQRFAQLGLPVSNSTLADQVGWATELLRPIWRAASAVVLGSGVMQLDGTGIPVRQRNGPNKLKLGTLWGYIGDGETALYLYTSTGKKRGQRPGELGPEDMLSMRSGYTVADAANLFDASFKRDDLIECGCNIHARRYFLKALESGDKRAALPLGVYKKFYKIETKLKDLSDEQRYQVRQEKIKPIYDELISWAEAHKPYEPPSTPMFKAIQYLLNHQIALRRFLENGAIPMDNSAVERLHIRVALTRKNFLFAGSDRGAERAAIAYTILGCCAMAEVDPVQYLNHVLARLSFQGIRLRDASDLLPANWKAGQNSNLN